MLLKQKIEPQKTLSFCAGTVELVILNMPVSAALAEMENIGAQIISADSSRVFAILKGDVARAQELVRNGWEWQ